MGLGCVHTYPGPREAPTLQTRDTQEAWQSLLIIVQDNCLGGFPCLKKKKPSHFRSKNENVLSTRHPKKYCPLIHDTALVSFPAGWAEPVFTAPYGTRLLSLGPVFILTLHQTVTSSSNLKSEDPEHKTFTPSAASRPRKKKLPFIISVG